MNVRWRANPKLVLVFIVSVITAFSIATAAGGAAGNVDIVLKKSLADNFEPSPDYRKYVVLPGDSLYLILRKLGIRKGIIPDYLEKFMAKNPHITDADLILPGQVLLIPLDNGESPTVIAGAEEGSPGPAVSDVLTPKDVLTPEKEEPGLPGKEVISLLTQAFVGVGETMQDTGMLYLPMQHSGTLSLDSSRYPSISLENGTMLIIDQDETLPDQVKKLIEVSWPHCRVIQPGRFPSAADLLDAVLDESGFYSVVRRKNLVLGGDAQVLFKCDWVLEKTPDSIIDGNLYAINYARHPREVIPQSIQKYARKYNIEVVNLGGDNIDTPKEADVPPPPASETLDHIDSPQLIDALLTRLGLAFSRNEVIKIYTGHDLGLTLTFRAQRMINNGSRKLVISFSEVAIPMKELLGEMGVDLLTIAPDFPPQEVIFSLLDALDIHFFGPDIEFFQSGDTGEDKFVIVIPGIFTSHRGESLFFTHTPLDENILSFLTARGVKTIIY